MTGEPEAAIAGKASGKPEAQLHEVGRDVARQSQACDAPCVTGRVSLPYFF